MPGPLGRRVPSDWKHVEKHPLRALRRASRPTNVPVVMGTNWYTAFDAPEKVGRIYVVARDGNLGTVRGGHCYCLKPPSLTDLTGWWTFYNQGSEGACVGFGSSRAISLLNRKRYDANWLYHRAQEVDEFPDTPPEEGTSVRAGLSVLKDEGEIIYNSRWHSRVTYTPQFGEGIAAFRWAITVDEIREALGVPETSSLIPFLNSWGRDYPHVTYIPDDVLDRLLREQGEAGIITDR